jgi:hypothetical protein
MTEKETPMSEPKAGDTVVIEVGDKTLTIEPVPYGNLKKIFGIIGNAVNDITVGKNAVMDIPKAIDQYLPNFFPLLFRKGTHDFITLDWIDNNLTLVAMKKIVETAIKVNGLEDFFERQRARAASPTTGSSITSSDSPTAGGPAT